MTRCGHDDDRLAEYVAGTMEAGDVEEFETHLLTCASCQQAVRLGAAARMALAHNGSGKAIAETHSAGRWAPVAGMALAAGLLIAVVVSRQRPAEDSLGRVLPAPFVGAAIRPSTDTVAALVDSGMAAYAESDFHRAADVLGRASAHDSSAAVRFFLGVSLLMRANAERAVRALEGVSLESPYGAEAAYYAAKALVRLQRTDSAIALLERAAGTGRLPAATRAFLDSLRHR